MPTRGIEPEPVSWQTVMAHEVPEIENDTAWVMSNSTSTSISVDLTEDELAAAQGEHND